MKPLLVILASVAGLGAVTWGLAYHDLIFTSFFAPKQEEIRRNVFEETKSFQTGAIQELQNMQFEYEKADKAHKPALANLIRHRAAEISESKIPSDLRSFIVNLPW
jgi:hypothetical protein